MCGIAGFFNPEMDFTKEKVYNLNILDAMNQAQKRRGPDDDGTFLMNISVWPRYAWLSSICSPAISPCSIGPDPGPSVSYITESFIIQRSSEMN